MIRVRLGKATSPSVHIEIMGIRIHQAVGYAMPCAEERYCKLIAPDAVTEGRLGEHNQWLKEHLDDFDADETVGIEMDIRETKALEDYRLVHFFRWSPADGGTLFVIPPGDFPDWYRHNNTMDYIFAGGEANDSIDYLDFGPYPHDGLRMDATTGKRLSSRGMDAARRIRLGVFGPYTETELCAKVTLVGDKGPGPYTTYDEVLTNVVPYVPDSVRRLAEYTRFFPNPAEVIALRPARSIWWG